MRRLTGARPRTTCRAGTALDGIAHSEGSLAGSVMTGRRHGRGLHAPFTRRVMALVMAILAYMACVAVASIHAAQDAAAALL